MRRTPAILALTLLPALALRARPAHAQLGIEGLASYITDVSFFTSCWRAKSPQIRSSDCPKRSRIADGLGVETSFKIRTVPLRQGRLAPGESPDTTVWDTVERQVNRRTGDTIAILRPTTRKRREPRSSLLFEFALGYSQHSGFSSADPALDLQASVRELPSASVYVTLQGDSVPLLRVVQPYVGLQTGFLQFQGTQSTRDAPGGEISAFQGTGNSLELGVVAGAGLDLHVLYLYGEIGSLSRRIPSIEWTSDASDTLPPGTPLSLDFSGREYTIGVQIPIRDF